MVIYMKYGYRKLQIEDLKNALDLVKRTFDEFEAPCYSEVGVDSFYKFANYENLKNEIENNDINILVATDYKKIIGVIAIKNKNHIAMLFVDKEYQKQGIGKKLIRVAKGEYNLNNTDLTVNSSPYAFEFYKKIGFEKIEEEKEIDGIKFIPMKLEKYKLNNAKGELDLVFPSIEHKQQVMGYLKEHLDIGDTMLNGAGGLERFASFEEWLEKINNDTDINKIPEGRVPSWLYLAIRKSDKRMVGIVQIRLLNERLWKTFGNIGDGVRPTERKKGYVTEIIRLALIKAKELGLNRVLMSCDKTNIGSKKSIINNGGIFENEYVDADGNLEERYWISLKKRSAVWDKERFDNIKEVEEKTITVNENDFKGDVHLNVFTKMIGRRERSERKCFHAEGYSWLEFYDYNSKFRLTAIYDNNGKIVEWYFDLSREIGKKDGYPYHEDWYLDVVLTPDGKIILLDEDEFDEAYRKFEMTEDEYHEGKRLVKDLMNRLEAKQDKIKEFTDKYLERVHKEGANF